MRDRPSVSLWFRCILQTDLLSKVKHFFNIEAAGGIGTLEEARRVGGGHLLQPLARGILHLPSKRVPELWRLTALRDLHRLTSGGDNACQLVCQLMLIVTGALQVRVNTNVSPPRCTF